MQTTEHALSPTSQSIDVLSHRFQRASGAATRDDQRVDLEGQITLRDANRGDSITVCTQNVSTTGVFIKTLALRPPGSIFWFELELARGLGSIQGQAEVMWVRHRDDGLFRPAGMGLRFVDLDPKSRQLMRRSVDHQTQELRKVLHLDAVEATPVTDSSTPQTLEPSAQAPDSAHSGNRSTEADSSPMAELRAEVDTALAEVLEGSRDLSAEDDTDWFLTPDESQWAPATHPGVGRRLWRIASAVPLVLAALGFYLLSPAPEPAAATSQTVQLASGQLDPSQLTPTQLDLANALAVTSATTSTVDTSDNNSGTIEGNGTIEKKLEQLIMAWAEAWTQQRARTHLAFYSPDFQPPNGLSRKDWETTREERILKPRHIQVEISDLKTETLSAHHAQVSFTQSYRSDSYQDTVRKSFELVRNEHGWQILAERSKPAV